MTNELNAFSASNKKWGFIGNTYKGILFNSSVYLTNLTASFSVVKINLLFDVIWSNFSFISFKSSIEKITNNITITPRYYNQPEHDFSSTKKNTIIISNDLFFNPTNKILVIDFFQSFFMLRPRNTKGFDRKKNPWNSYSWGVTNLHFNRKIKT